MIAVVNLVIPILVVPQISLAIGLEQFGVYTLAAAAFQYGVLVTEFSTTAPLVKSISLSGYNEGKNTLFSIINFRLLLAIIASVLIIIFIIAYGVNVSYIDVALGCFSLVGVAVSPIAIFQINQTLPAYALITCVSRFLISLLIIVSIKYYHIGGVFLAMLFQFSVLFFANPIAWIYLVIKKQISKKELIQIFFISGQPKNKKETINIIKESFSLFTGAFFSSLYTLAIPILIKELLGDSAVGAYGLIDRVSQPMKQAISPLMNVVYPKICSYLKKSTQEALVLFYKIILLMLAFSIVFCVVGYCGSGTILLYVFKSSIDIRFILPTVINIVAVYLSQALISFYIVPFGFSHTLKYIYLILFFIFCFSFYPLIEKMGELGIYWAIAVLEIIGLFIFASCFFGTVKNLNRGGRKIYD